MVAIVLFLAVFHSVPESLKAQIPTDYDATEAIPDSVLVREWLIGEGVETFNITSTGHINSRGFFIGTSNLGIESGVILASGHVENSEGPNNTDSKETVFGTPGDPILAQLSGNPSYDASILEFDFIPQSNTVEFRYVFGSEEYPEYTAQPTYNDVFGFFISGPDIYGPYPSPPAFPNGSINIAILPILTFPATVVSIYNINNGPNNTGPCANCEYYVNNGTGITPNANPYIQYDGFTTVLTARAVVVPCQTYHIKLAISDISDGRYDSGVFLEANSFSSVGLGANVAFTHEEVDTAVEGCNSANVVFKLFQITPVDYDIILDVGGTATRGIDYIDIPDTLTIPQGQDSIILTIDPIEDMLPEDINETVTLIFNSSLCPQSAQFDTVTLYIKDLQPFSSYASPGQTINCEDTITLVAAGDGGQVPYYYNWSTGETTETITVSPPNPTTYTVQISDVCGQSETQSIPIDVIGPDAVASDDINLCIGNSTTLSVQGGTSWLWQSSPPDASLSGQETLQTPTVSPGVTTLYTVTAYDACGNEDVDQVTVFVGELVANAGTDVTICTGQTTTLSASPSGDLAYEWFDENNVPIGNTQSIDVSPMVTTTYKVVITDNNCNSLTSDALVTVTVIDMTVSSTADQTVVCAGSPVELSASNNPSSGSGIYTWTDEFNNIVGTGAIISVIPDITTTYSCTINDGCEKVTTPLTITVNQLPAVSATAPAGSICPDEYISLTASGAVNYYWSSNPVDATLSGQETAISPSVSPTENTIYTLSGTDANGCENTDVVSISVKPRMYADFSSAVDAACEGDMVLFTYNGNANTSADYQWDFDGVTRTGQGPINFTWTAMGTKTITLVVTQDLCVSDPVSHTIEIRPKPVVDFTYGNTEGCVPLTVDFTDASTNTTPDVSFLWDFGAAGTSDKQSPSMEFTAPGKYDVSLKVTNPGCETTYSVPMLVDAWPVPVAGYSANPPKVSMKNPVITFTSTSTGDNLTYQWNTGDGFVYDTSVFVHTYADSGIYQVQLVVENSYGCANVFTDEVIVTARYMLRIPTAFTPNGDGLNDVFGITGNGVKKFSVSIYNRWGSLIFNSNNINVSWDGKINGQPAEPGLYVYKTFFMDENDEVSEQTGSFLLVK